jgi:hypothetical protein
MKITETASSKKNAGGSIDSWCGKCKLVLAHTIKAMAGDKPARVQCNTCKALHTYSVQQPAASTRQTRHEASGASKSQGAKPGSSRHRLLLKGKDTTRTKAYSSSERYAPGDVMHHVVFGLGVATLVKDGTKVQVLFECGSKLLIHDR